MVGYFVRGDGESWALIRLTDGYREEVVADGLLKEAAIDQCFERLEELSARRAAGGSMTNTELPFAEIPPRRRKLKQLSLNI